MMVLAVEGTGPKFQNAGYVGFHMNNCTSSFARLLSNPLGSRLHFSGFRVIFDPRHKFFLNK